MFGPALPAAVFLEPPGVPLWREPAFGAVLLLMLVLFGLHRLLARGMTDLFDGGHAARPSAVSGGGPRSALSVLRAAERPAGFTGQGEGFTGLGAEGFLRAVLVEVVTRGGGRAVLSRPEFHRLLGGLLEPRLLALLAFRLTVHEDAAEAARQLELCLSESEEGSEEDLYWFLVSDRVPGPPLEHERLHILLLGPWRHTREVSSEGLMEGEAVPTLTVSEAVERLHLFGLTLLAPAWRLRRSLAAGVLLALPLLLDLLQVAFAHVLGRPGHVASGDLTGCGPCPSHGVVHDPHRLRHREHQHDDRRADPDEHPRFEDQRDSGHGERHEHRDDHQP